MSIRSFVKYGLSVLLYYSGGLWLYRGLRRTLLGPRLNILTYHGVDDRPNYIDLFMGVKKFDRQMHYISQAYDVLSLDKAVQKVKSPASLDRDAVVVTIDDGYRDNYTNALPILRRYRTPALIYLTTQPMDQNFTTFIDAVLKGVDLTKREEIDLTAHGLDVFSLKTKKQKQQAIQAIDRKGKSLPLKKREAFLDDVLKKLGFSRGDDVFTQGMLTWDHVSEMQNGLVSFGAHTVHHPVLSRLSKDEVEQEIVTSKKRIEEKTKRPVRHFAYPYGGRDAVNEDVIAVTKKQDLDSAVVLYRAPHRSNQLFRLGRVMVSDGMTSTPWGSFSRALFACEVSGVFDTLFARKN